MELLRIATAGSVDDGKSTLIGRLLFDSKALFDDQLANIEHTSAQRGDAYVNLALVTDGLRAEREQGITIDVAYRYFATPRRKFIIADTPGHQRYTRNMVTGASTADLAIVLVDARLGVLEQSRRHAFVASLLGISHVVVCVNKMDLVGWSQDVCSRITEDFAAFAAKLEIRDVTFIPISALHGDNVVDRSRNMPWYEGPPLLYHLEHVHITSDRNFVDCRFPVQWVIRPIDEAHHDYRGYAGRVASGVLRRGDEVVVLPSMARTRVARIETFDGEATEAFPPMNVTVMLTDDLDVSRGDMLCRPQNLPSVQKDLEAMLCWFDEEPLREDKAYVLLHTTRSIKATVQSIRYRIDVTTLSRGDATTLAMNDIGRVHLRAASPLFFDDYQKNRETGCFVLVDPANNGTVAAGMLMDVHVAPSPNDATRGGAVVWLTGLSGSGKSTIGDALRKRLERDGRAVFVVDGDDLRKGLSSDLGFSAADRRENVRRASHVASMLAKTGHVAIVTLISPETRAREDARRVAEKASLPFIEVWVSTPLEECERRDPKGLYKRARAGEIPQFTGIHEPYEPPSDADVNIPIGATIDEAVDQIHRTIARATLRSAP